MAYFEDRAAYRSSIEKWHPARGGEDDYIYIYICIYICVCVHTHVRGAAPPLQKREKDVLKAAKRKQPRLPCRVDWIKGAPAVDCQSPLIVLSFAVRPVLRLISGGAY